MTKLTSQIVYISLHFGEKFIWLRFKIETFKLWNETFIRIFGKTANTILECTLPALKQSYGGLMMTADTTRIYQS